MDKTNITFIQALEELKNGATVKRDGWSSGINLKKVTYHN